MNYSWNDRFKHIFIMDYDVGRSREIREWLIIQFGVGGYDKDWDFEVWIDNGGCYSYYFVHKCAYQWFLLRWA